MLPVVSTASLLPILNVLGGIASIAGLVYSILAFKQAKSASEAARAARDAIIISTAGDELALACRRADQLVEDLWQRRFPEAHLRAEELLASLAEFRQRRVGICWFRKL